MSASFDIDAAWEERILPALSEYTRIPCLSPAFDPDWEERGAIAAAAELLATWVKDQEPALTVEIVTLPGRRVPHSSCARARYAISAGSRIWWRSALPMRASGGAI